MNKILLICVAEINLNVLKVIKSIFRVCLKFNVEKNNRITAYVWAISGYVVSHNYLNNAKCYPIWWQNYCISLRAPIDMICISRYKKLRGLRDCCSGNSADTSV